MDDLVKTNYRCFVPKKDYSLKPFVFYDFVQIHNLTHFRAVIITRHYRLPTGESDTPTQLRVG